MSRALRLNELLQVMRRRRGTVSGEALARETNVSLRTIRRDVATLQGMGARIEGEAGVGYILRPGFGLPPMSFTEEEIRALVAGARWVSGQTDPTLALAAQNALAKIQGVIPAEMRPVMEEDAIYVGGSVDAIEIDLGAVRRSLREQRKMRILYADQHGLSVPRTVWPLMVGYVESRRFLSGWCELHGGFQLFRVDRIREAAFLEERYPGDRRILVKEWRKQFCPSQALCRAEG